MIAGPHTKSIRNSLHPNCAWLATGLIAAVLHTAALQAGQIEFERIQLSDQFYGEGGTYGDFDGDGHGDVAIGPWIYYGPSFTEKSRFYTGEAFDPAVYSQNFLMYSDDVDGDGHPDILVLGFPGKESWWYQNPGGKTSQGTARDQLWAQHTILASVDNESPLVADIDGDGVKDLICSSQGHYGYATHAGQSPTDPWRFVRISPNNNYQRFTHGLGIGDVNNDGHLDLIEKDGWWQNPNQESGREKQTAAEHWVFHPFAFAGGGSQMFAVDLTGDGRNEVLTGLAAHGFGLVYYRATNPAATQFERVEIMSDDPATSPVGLAVSQLHAVDLGDINGDGVPDIVTGKRWWAHANHDPGSSQPAILLWLETQRSGDRVRFIPHVIDISSGVGTQVMVGDVNGDGLQDIVSGNKRGAYLFLQRPADLPASESLVPKLAAADPYGQRAARESLPLKASTDFVPAIDGRRLNFGFEAGDVSDWELRGTMAATALVELAAGSGFEGKFAIDTGSSSPKLLGELISRPFELTHPKLSFLLSGQADPEARVEIVDETTGLVLQAIQPKSPDVPQRVSFDCSSHQGKTVRIRVVDHSDKGYVCVDDFRLQ